ncbi:helicase associated domain-containing protein [Streptomyces kronopolitis]|uniref:helicase associated domain-containing protein n=1 Tax=Streptomyces kronopolitis TaxID=1612435 RepID=UPI003F4DD3B1
MLLPFAPDDRLPEQQRTRAPGRSFSPSSRSGCRSWAYSPTRPRPLSRQQCLRRRARAAQAAFQRGLTALTQWVEREGTHRPVPRGHSEEITVNGEAEPVIVKLGVWISNTKSRRDRLDTAQLDALSALGMDRAKVSA